MSKASELLEALGLVTNAQIQKAGYDKTVVGTIVSMNDEKTYTFTVKYGDAIHTAKGSKKYEIGDQVYITIPASDEAAWQILSVAQGKMIGDSWIDYKDIPSDNLIKKQPGTFFPIGSVLQTITIQPNVTSFQVYASDLLEYIKQHKSIYVSIDIDIKNDLKTMITESGDIKEPSYEVSFQFYNLPKKTITVNDVIGHPFTKGIKTVVARLSFTDEELKELSSFWRYCLSITCKRQIIKETSNKIADINFKNLCVYGVISQQSIEQEQTLAYSLNIDNKSTLTELNVDCNEIILVPTLYQGTSAIPTSSNIEYQWYRKETDWKNLYTDAKWVKLANLNSKELIGTKDFAISAYDDLEYSQNNSTWAIKKPEGATYAGLKLQTNKCKVGSVYKLSYDVKQTDGTLLQLGGYDDAAFETLDWHIIMSGNKYLQSGAYSSSCSLPLNKETVKNTTYRIVAYLKYVGSEGIQEPCLYLQPNRGLSTAVSCNISNISFIETPSALVIDNTNALYETTEFKCIASYSAQDGVKKSYESSVITIHNLFKISPTLWASSELEKYKVRINASSCIEDQKNKEQLVFAQKQLLTSSGDIFSAKVSKFTSNDEQYVLTLRLKSSLDIDLFGYQTEAINGNSLTIIAASGEDNSGYLGDVYKDTIQTLEVYFKWPNNNNTKTLLIQAKAKNKEETLSGTIIEVFSASVSSTDTFTWIIDNAEAATVAYVDKAGNKQNKVLDNQHAMLSSSLPYITIDASLLGPTGATIYCKPDNTEDNDQFASIIVYQVARELTNVQVSGATTFLYNLDGQLLNTSREVTLQASFYLPGITEPITSGVKWQWYRPNENTLIEDWPEDTSGSSITFNMARYYDINKTNNTVTVIATYKGTSYTTTISLAVVQEGELGTSGRDILCRIGIQAKTAESFWGDIEYPSFYSWPSSNDDNATYKAIEVWDEDLGMNTCVLKQGDNEVLRLIANLYNAASNIINISVDDIQWYIWDTKGGYNNGTSSTFKPGEDVIVVRVVDKAGAEHYAYLPIARHFAIRGLSNEATNITLEEGSGYVSVMYEPSGANPNYAKAPFRIKTLGWTFDTVVVEQYQDITEGSNESPWKTLDSFIVDKHLIHAYIIPPQSFSLLDKYSKKIRANFIVTNNSNSSAQIYLPLIMAYNIYGNAAINNWDGGSIAISSSEILAPMAGFGTKSSTTNAFTGVLLGKVRNKNGSIGSERIGIIGRRNTSETFFLNSETGSATFGQLGKGQIEFKPGTSGEMSTAQILGGEYDSYKQGASIDQTVKDQLPELFQDNFMHNLKCSKEIPKQGSKINLTNGSIMTPHFVIDSDGVFVDGCIYANSGKIGAVAVENVMASSAEDAYSWRFSPSNGLYMWSGEQGNGLLAGENGEIEDDPNLVFRVKDKKAYFNGDGKFTGHIEANSGHIKSNVTFGEATVKENYLLDSDKFVIGPSYSQTGGYVLIGTYQLTKPLSIGPTEYTLTLCVAPGQDQLSIIGTGTNNEQYLFAVAYPNITSDNTITQYQTISFTLANAALPPWVEIPDNINMTHLSVYGPQLTEENVSIYPTYIKWAKLQEGRLKEGEQVLWTPNKVSTGGNYAWYFDKNYGVQMWNNGTLFYSMNADKAFINVEDGHIAGWSIRPDSLGFDTTYNGTPISMRLYGGTSTAKFGSKDLGLTAGVETLSDAKITASGNFTCSVGSNTTISCDIGASGAPLNSIKSPIVQKGPDTKLEITEYQETLNTTVQKSVTWTGTYNLERSYISFTHTAGIKVNESWPTLKEQPSNRYLHAYFSDVYDDDFAISTNTYDTTVFDPSLAGTVFMELTLSSTKPGLTTQTIQCVVPNTVSNIDDRHVNFSAGEVAYKGYDVSPKKDKRILFVWPSIGGSGKNASLLVKIGSEFGWYSWSTTYDQEYYVTLTGAFNESIDKKPGDTGSYRVEYTVSSPKKTLELKNVTYSIEGIASSALKGACTWEASVKDIKITSSRPSYSADIPFSKIKNGTPNITTTNYSFSGNAGTASFNNSTLTFDLSTSATVSHDEIKVQYVWDNSQDVLADYNKIPSEITCTISSKATVSTTSNPTLKATEAAYSNLASPQYFTFDADPVKLAANITPQHNFNNISWIEAKGVVKDFKVYGASWPFVLTRTGDIYIDGEAEMGTLKVKQGLYILGNDNKWYRLKIENGSLKVSQESPPS